MTWTHILMNRPHVADDLAADFPHLDVKALRRFRGDRVKMDRYLAQAHDLTLAEAAETLDDWFSRNAARPRSQIAA